MSHSKKKKNPITKEEGKSRYWGTKDIEKARRRKTRRGVRQLEGHYQIIDGEIIPIFSHDIEID